MSIAAKVLRRVASKTTAAVNQVYFSVAPSKLECNLCGYKANTFLNDGAWHKGTRCPKCGSAVRQRLLWAALQRLDQVSADKVVKGKRVLHFAPEGCLRKALGSIAGDYKTADLFAEGYYYRVDYKIDITDMPSVPDGDFDCVIACDVLEHVNDDGKALREIHRVLKPGGYCILTVPQKDNLAQTLEDPSIVDPAERERVYGQRDHLRIYGDDFADMVSRAGFEVLAVDESFFDKESGEKNVLFPPDPPGEPSRDQSPQGVLRQEALASVDARQPLEDLRAPHHEPSVDLRG